MKAAALVFACTLAACNDGVIHLSSGAQAPDATTPGLTEGTADGGGPVAEGGPTGDGSAHEGGPGCVADADCLLASLHCDVGSGACVECTDDAQCTKPGYPRCNLASNRCVECGLSSDCADGGVCNPATLRCAVACGDAGCPDDDEACDSHGYCVTCGSAKDGGGCNGTAVCDDDNGQCAECTLDSQCPSARPRCNQSSDACVQCVASSQCPVVAPVCDPATWTCVVP